MLRADVDVQILEVGIENRVLLVALHPRILQVVEDAMHATRAAVEEGIVAGGGVALIRCTSSLAALVFDDDRRYGVNIIRRALEEPLRQIAQNSGGECLAINRAAGGGGQGDGGGLQDGREICRCLAQVDPNTDDSKMRRAGAGACTSRPTACAKAR